MSESSMLSVIGLNCLLAVLTGWLAYRLWRWRCWLTQLTSWLRHTASAPLCTGDLGYAIALKRVQLAEARLGIAQWQLRSRQTRQILQFAKFLRLLLLYRAVRR